MIHVVYRNTNKILFIDTQTNHIPRIKEYVKLKNIHYQVDDIITDLTLALDEPTPWFLQNKTFEVLVYMHEQEEP